MVISTRNHVRAVVDDSEASRAIFFVFHLSIELGFRVPSRRLIKTSRDAFAAAAFTQPRQAGPRARPGRDSAKKKARIGHAWRSTDEALAAGLVEEKRSKPRLSRRSGHQGPGGDARGSISAGGELPDRAAARPPMARKSTVPRTGDGGLAQPRASRRAAGRGACFSRLVVLRDDESPSTVLAG